MKTCKNCNAEVADNLKFCGKCGTAFETALVPDGETGTAPDYSERYDIFLSYRRDGGEAMAILLRDRLVAKGYNVFLDIENLNSGTFNNKLFDVIDNCKDFVLICSKGALDRCVNDGDWVRMEIAHALGKNKNIVPIMLRGFEFPEALPSDIEGISMHNGVNANSHEYFDAAIDRMAAKFLKSKPEVIAPVTHTTPVAVASAPVTSSAPVPVVAEPVKKKSSAAKVIAPIAACLVLVVGAYFYMNMRNNAQPVDSPQTETAANPETAVPAAVVNEETQPPETVAADTSAATTVITLSPEEISRIQEEAVSQAIADALATATVAEGIPLQSDDVQTSAAVPLGDFEVGDVIKFGEYEWRVLFMKDGKALIITEDVILKRKYDGLLEFINSEDFMYITFSAQEQERMIDTNLTDLFEKKEKAYKLIPITRDQINLYFDDEKDRVATYNGSRIGWWIYEKYSSASVRTISSSGYFDYMSSGNEGIGVRPAVWITY